MPLPLSPTRGFAHEGRGLAMPPRDAVHGVLEQLHLVSTDERAGADADLGAPPVATSW
jgi:hypothetical protein